MATEFQLDAEGVILGCIREDADEFLQSAYHKTYERHERGFVSAAASILLHHTHGAEAAHQEQAFTIGAATVLEAFEASDLNENLREHVRDNFVRQATPVDLLKHDKETTRRAFEAEEQRGALAHAEIRPHLDRLYGHLHNPLYGRYVKLGGWFTAHRLDICYEQYMRKAVPELLGVVHMTEVDWNSLLREA